MTPLGPAAIRSRTVRSTILRVLNLTFAANPDVCVLARQVYAVFGTGRLPYERAEVDVELSVLMDDGLIVPIEVDMGEAMPEKGYKLTRKGRDFINAGLPWGKVDQFSAEPGESG